MITSAYIHIPFCEHICHYCDFTKFFYNEASATAYIRALKREIQTKIQHKNTPIETIFIGGGTPTSLNVKQLQNLLEIIDKTFDVANCEEYTIEANPGDFAEDKIKLLKNYGVNRVSLGVQVFDDAMLDSLGRAHRVKDVYTTINQLKKHGFSNISIDLIYALPNQTVNGFRQTVSEALSFDLPHYSSYSLQIEPKTIFYNRYRKGQLHRPQQEEEVKMYAILKQMMTENGKEQYEISNFAQRGYESKHNLTYWNNEYYYGFGAGAHGYIRGTRYGNIRPLPQYIEKAMTDGNPVLTEVDIGLKERIEEQFFLGLRKRKGVHKAKFKQKFGFSHDEVYQRPIEDLMKKGWLTEDEEFLRLTDQGVLFGNDVFAQFLLDDEDLKHVN